MAEPSPTYKKFSGKSAGIFRTSRLWTEGDHLLSVQYAYGHEQYSRFYPGEIEAIVVRETGRWRNFNLVCGILLALLLAAASWFYWQMKSNLSHEVPQVLFVASLILASPFFLGLLINLLKGATAELFLQTRSGLVRLPMVRRRRKAYALRAKLIPYLQEQVAKAAAEIPSTPLETLVASSAPEDSSSLPGEPLPVEVERP